MTAQITWVDYFQGQASLVYANDWSNVTGYYTVDGEEGVEEWSVDQGVTNQADWQADCMYVSNGECTIQRNVLRYLSVPGSLDGLWERKDDSSYYCTDENEIAGSYRHSPDVDFVEYGFYDNGTIFGPENKNARVYWEALTGPEAGVGGYKIMKGEFK